jgi:hypothetical protein
VAIADPNRPSPITAKLLLAIASPTAAYKHEVHEVHEDARRT